MTDKEIVQALRCCAKGLGHDDACENCKVGETQDRLEYIEFAAANVIERLTAENVVLPDGQASVIESLRKEIEWKDMVIALAQRKQVEAEEERDTLREKQRWIPVTERLPERDVQVLGWYKDNPFSQYRHEVVAWNGNGWVFVYAHRYVTNVTHWMPLPEAPEVDL